MKRYTDEALQKHEFNYWQNHHDKSKFPNTNYYKSFFDFERLTGSKILDIGCGGFPVSEYNPNITDLTLMDPLLEQLSKLEKFSHINKYTLISKSILDAHNLPQYDFVVCLNVIDHFADDDLIFVDKFNEFLKPGGELWLQYDVRPHDCCDHLAVNDNAIIEKIKSQFELIKINNDINPICRGWSDVYKSTRIIAKKYSSF